MRRCSCAKWESRLAKLPREAAPTETLRRRWECRLSMVWGRLVMALTVRASMSSYGRLRSAPRSLPVCSRHFEILLADVFVAKKFDRLLLEVVVIHVEGLAQSVFSG